MRRLWAHIIIACAAFIAVFATVPSLIKGITTDGNYETRRKFTFQLTQRTQEDEADKIKELGADSAKEIAKIMESRLIQYNVSSYDITTGTTYNGKNGESISDIVDVTFAADSKEKYEQVVKYLTFSGSFAFVNKNNDLVESDLFRDGDAYLKNSSVNEYPTVILPIKTDYTEWEALVQGAIDTAETIEPTEEGGEATKKAEIILLYNYQKGDTYDILKEKGELTEDKKLFLSFEFDPDDKDSLYYDSDKNSLAQPCGFTDINGNGYADPTEVRSAFNKANYLYNLFNASALDYEVKCIGGLLDGSQMWVEAKTESIVSQGKIVWNATLTATVAAIVIISLLMVVFYRLGALSGLICSLVSVYAAFAFMVLTGMEYGALALVAIVLVGAVSLISSIIYNNKLKEDAYKGHTLKKANTEASKKSLLPIIDLHVVSLLLGLMAFLLGGAALHAFGAILSLGTIASLIINLIGLKGMMWLATNATKLSGKYEYFGIDSNNVPNHLAEEKQRYFGPYAEKDLTKKKKPVGIASLSAFGLALVGIIVAASLQSGSIFKAQQSKVVGNEIVIQNRIIVKDKESESPLDDNTLMTDILDVITYETKDNKTGKPVYVKLSDKDYIFDSYKSFVVTENVTVDDIPTEYRTTYYVVSFKGLIDKNAKAKAGDVFSEDITLADAINKYIDESSVFKDTETSMSLKDIESYVVAESPEWTKVTLATSIALLIITVYMMIRYRLSRGLTSLIFPVASSVVSLGLITLFSAIGASIPAAVSIILPVVSLFSYVFAILFMNKERELINDDKTRDISFEHRQELSIKAMGMAYTPILASAVIGIYLLINFFGFGVASSSFIYLFAILGAIITLGLISVLYVPVSNFLLAKFSALGANRKPKESKKKKNKPVVKKSAEPEEAIFIGIND